jgi:hypothetical protein
MSAFNTYVRAGKHAGRKNVIDIELTQSSAPCQRCIYVSGVQLIVAHTYGIKKRPILAP